jgi:uncharacterized protein YdeI (YjbR/CyaY-like superfamily)
VEKLIQGGRMTEAGLAVVEEAKRNGSWSHLDSVENLEVPADLTQALAADDKARQNFEKLAPSHRKQYLYWINAAKREDTRRRRIKETIRLVAEKKKSRLD